MNKYFGSSFFTEIAIYIFIIVLLITIVIFINLSKNRKLKLLQEEKEIAEDVINILDISKGVEHNLIKVLNIVKNIIEAPSYAVYLLDDKKKSFLLKSTSQMVDENMKIQPAYSGLSPYKKEIFNMPPSLPEKIITNESKKIKEGEVPLVITPFKNKKGLVLIGPVKKVTKRQLYLLDYLIYKGETIINTLVEVENLNEKMKLKVTSEKAVKNFSNFFSDFMGILNLIMKVSIKTISAKGGLFVSNENGKLKINSAIGLNEEIKDIIKTDYSILEIFDKLIMNKNFVSISREDSDFYKIPPYFIAEEAQVILIMRVSKSKENGIAVFWYDKIPKIKEYQVAVLQIMTKRMEDIITSYKRFKELSGSYVDILKTLATLIDNLKPSTIGYSELMYRYAIIISRELGLEQTQIDNIALAAYLSNIGVIGLSDNILFKSGKYTDLEYETMKFHSEAGAALIEATTGNSEVASIIKHHHERIDGYGYPGGLKGEEIPIGSKIIAVIQTFLAKILSREYRSPLPFDKAIAQLQSAVGTQLDKYVVEALVNWFEKKQRQFKKQDGSLGPCSEMRCSTENICIHCDAYKNNTKNCWEFENVNCKEHGNTCENCFVYSEYLSRMKKR